MAQYVFDAKKYPPGTLLSDLGFWENTQGNGVDFVVVNSTYTNYWRQTYVADNVFMTSKTKHTAYELLFLIREQEDRQRSSGNAYLDYHGFKIFYGVTQTGGNYTDLRQFLSRRKRSNSTTEHTVSQVGGSLSITTNNAPAIGNAAMATRFRMQADGNFFSRTWNRTIAIPFESLEVQEPTGWNLEGNTGLAGTEFAICTPVTHGATAVGASVVTCISIGTDGDPAPTVDDSIVLTPPTVSVTNVTGTSATVSWT